MLYPQNGDSFVTIDSVMYTEPPSLPPLGSDSSPWRIRGGTQIVRTPRPCSIQVASVTPRIVPLRPMFHGIGHFLPRCVTLARYNADVLCSSTRFQMTARGAPRGAANSCARWFHVQSKITTRQTAFIFDPHLISTTLKLTKKNYQRFLLGNASRTSIRWKRSAFHKVLRWHFSGVVEKLTLVLTRKI